MEAYDDENNSGPSNAERADFVSLYDEYQGLIKKDKPSFLELVNCGAMYALVGSLSLIAAALITTFLIEFPWVVLRIASLLFIFAGIGWVVKKYLPNWFFKI